ncbi:MAG: hypothetical protein RMM53_00070 [Bacteroidia bacterium]|nr:hypothetical protein [Bacteroidia bacterium]MDW8332589.1 hypothetical protein [Bacteroidia bacterium]
MSTTFCQSFNDLSHSQSFNQPILPNRKRQRHIGSPDDVAIWKKIAVQAGVGVGLTFFDV